MSDETEMLTLTEVSNRTGISMPTLQRYKKEYQDRIPSEGQGRRQRYPEESLQVFEEIKKENIAKRGRPRKEGGSPSGASGSARKKSRKSSSGSSDSDSASSSASDGAASRPDLLTLKEVSERSGISYPTLVRYVKEHKANIPFEGKGRRRRYYPEAVAVFEELRANRGKLVDKSVAREAAAAAGTTVAVSRGSGDGGSRKGDPSLARRVRSLEKSQEKLEKQIKDLLTELRKPMTVTLKRGK